MNAHTRALKDYLQEDEVRVMTTAISDTAGAG